MIRRLVLLIAAAALLAGLAAAPVSADPPNTGEFPIVAFPLDQENRLLTLWNTTRADICDWAAGGFMGDLPVIENVPAQGVETGQGAVVTKFTATRPMEVWALTPEADTSDPGSFDGCDDANIVVDGGPWATGTAQVSGNDNDFDVSGTRTNVFGDRGQGTVEADGDTYHYSWVFLAQIDKDGEFVVRVPDRTSLHKIGN